MICAELRRPPGGERLRGPRRAARCGRRPYTPERWGNGGRDVCSHDWLPLTRRAGNHRRESKGARIFRWAASRRDPGVQTVIFREKSAAAIARALRLLFAL